MSDVTTGTAFNPQFFMNPPWWLGRVEEKGTWSDNIEGETFTSVSGIKGWGHRYKVRVFNWHTGDVDNLAPKDMAYCQVVMPVTSGSGHGGAAQTPSIEAGSVVFGFFMDGMAGQEGYIMGVLGNSNNNVPKKRGEPAPNQNSTTLSSTGGTTTTKPPTPVTGEGSLSQVPLSQIPNIDALSSDQLKKLLDPSKTPSSAVFKAASEARQKAKLAGLPAAEVERQVLLATVKASKQPGADAGANANCNKGYQQFSDTYTDGDPMRAAKVPDDRRIASTPLATTEALHIETFGKTDQNKDGRKVIPLSDVVKKNNSDNKGIQRVLKNLINAIEELKKKYNQASAFATQVSEFTQLVQQNVTNAIEEISSFTKNIIQGVRGYVLKIVSDQTKKIYPSLFPSEAVGFDKKVEKGLSLVNKLFNNITSGLKALLANVLSKVLDRFINAPMCAVENVLGGLMDKVLGPIMSVVQNIFNSFGSLFSKITSGGKSFGNLFDALEFVPGIKKFFAADVPQSAVKYSEISQDRSALPGGDSTTTTNPDESPTGTGSDSAASSANVVNNTTSLDQELSAPITQAERDAVSRGEILGGGTISSRGNIRDDVLEE